MKRQQRFVEIILLLLLALVVSFWGYRGYRFMQAHPLVNRVYRYQASSAAKAELTSTQMTTSMWYLALADIGENTLGSIIKSSCAEF